MMFTGPSFMASNSGIYGGRNQAFTNGMMNGGGGYGGGMNRQMNPMPWSGGNRSVQSFTQPNNYGYGNSYGGGNFNPQPSPIAVGAGLRRPYDYNLPGQGQYAPGQSQMGLWNRYNQMPQQQPNGNDLMY